MDGFRGRIEGSREGVLSDLLNGTTSGKVSKSDNGTGHLWSPLLTFQRLTLWLNPALWKPNM